MRNHIYTENCLDTMARMQDDFLDLTVTSPPYDNLRSYKGYSFPFEEIAKELYRVTKKGGIVVWVVGDATVKGSETGNSFRQALYFMECGFNLHDTMIYMKENPLPQNHNRYEQCFEYMFVFTKGKPNTLNKLTEPCSTAGKTYDYSKRGSATADELNPAARTKNAIIATKETKPKKNIWGYFTGHHKSSKDKIAFQHPAIFPEKLAEDHIISWSNEGDVVYDPFAGSGTTLKMAKLNNRNYIGSEMSSEYVETIIKPRLANV